MAYTLQIGTIRCHILSDGRQRVDGGGFFGLVPRLLWERVVPPDPQNRIAADLRCLLIEGDQGLILVDTGQGDKLTAKDRRNLGMDHRNERLLDDLRSLGYTAADISMVFLTHLHGDHAGGATRWTEGIETPELLSPTFPQARYLVQRLELADASFPNERTRGTYFGQNWEPLAQAGLLDMVDGDQQLDRGVYTETIPGHTASIQAVWVESNGETLLFLGDTCSWAAHMNRLAWVPSFDLFPMTSIEGKRRLRRQALQREALLVFQHDCQVVSGRLVVDGREPRVEVEIAEQAWENGSG